MKKISIIGLLIFSISCFSNTKESKHISKKNNLKVKCVIGTCDIMYKDVLDWCLHHGYTQCRSEDIATTVFVSCKQQNLSAN